MYKNQSDLQMGENSKKDDVLSNMPSVPESTEQYDHKAKIPVNLHEAYVWKHSDDFTRYVNENKLEVKGVTGDKKAAGIILEGPISLSDATKLVVHVDGLEEQNNRFSGKRLFWLIIDGMTAQPISKIDQNDADASYVNARNGDFIFPLSGSTLESGQISKLEIVFYDSKIDRLFLMLWLM